MSENYYFIKDLKCFARGDGFDNYIYDNGNWIPDKENRVSDRLMGYDPYEDDDSPYKIGNRAIIAEIETITEEEFLNRIKAGSIKDKKQPETSMTYSEFRKQFKTVDEFRKVLGKLSEEEVRALIVSEERPELVKACIVDTWRSTSQELAETGSEQE